MSIDFYVCDKCGETFPDCSEYTYCEDCNGNLCGDCSKEIGNYIYMNKEICPFCRKDIITDNMLLHFALRILDVTRQELEEKYREET